MLYSAELQHMETPGQAYDVAKTPCLGHFLTIIFSCKACTSIPIPADSIFSTPVDGLEGVFNIQEVSVEALVVQTWMPKTLFVLPRTPKMDRTLYVPFKTPRTYEDCFHVLVVL